MSGRDALHARASESLTFADFAKLRESILSAAPAPGARPLLDLSETAMARALEPHKRSIDSLQVPNAGHRCHVASAWLSHFSLPDAWANRAMVTQGVRAALNVLFSHYARRGQPVLIPSDVYPTYASLAQATACEVQTYEANRPLTPGTLQATRATAILLSNPIKPYGRLLSLDEFEALMSWLNQDRGRRILIDAVYTFSDAISSRTLDLYATGQVIVLHSLSKGWAQPLTAGVALLPESDVLELIPLFRAQPGLPGATKNTLTQGFALAHALLAQDPSRPAILADVLGCKRERLHDVVRERGITLASASWPQGQYLFVINTGWRELLHDHDVLALPASVFRTPGIPESRSEAKQSVVSSLLL